MCADRWQMAYERTIQSSTSVKSQGAHSRRNKTMLEQYTPAQGMSKPKVVILVAETF